MSKIKEATNYVVLSRDLNKHGLNSVVHITNLTPQGGMRVLQQSPLVETKLGIARSAWRSLQSDSLDVLVEMAMQADMWYVKKGKLVCLYGTEGAKNAGTKVSDSKRVARFAGNKQYVNTGENAIEFPVIQTVSMQGDKLYRDGHGWISRDYLRRNGIPMRRGKKHYEFTAQLWVDGQSVQYKGQCVIGKLPKGVDLVVPNDPKYGVVWGEKNRFFGINLGYSHTETRIDSQTLCNTANWIDYTDVIQHQANTICHNIEYGNVAGRGTHLSHDKWGTLPSMIETYRQQEIRHLEGREKRGFRIPTFGGLIAFSKHVPEGHVQIDADDGLVVVNPVYFLSSIRAKLGGMDGDDHVLVLFCVDVDGTECVLLYRQPNQLGEMVKLHLYNGKREDYITLPPVRIVGDIPTPAITNLVDKAVMPNITTPAQLCKFIIEAQLSSTKLLGETANAGMLFALLGLTPPKGVYPDLEPIIAGEKDAIDPTRLKEWIKDAKTTLMGIPKLLILRLPANVKAKLNWMMDMPTAEMNIKFSETLDKNLVALNLASDQIARQEPARRGIQSIFDFAVEIDDQLKALPWVKEFAQLVIAQKPNDPVSANDKFQKVIEDRIAEIGRMSFMQEVVVAMVRAWFAELKYDGGKWGTATYALAHRSVLPFVENILMATGDEPVMDVMRIQQVIADIPNILYVKDGCVFNHTGAMVGHCGLPDGRYDHGETFTKTNNELALVAYRGAIPPISAWAINKNAPTVLGGNGVRIAPTKKVVSDEPEWDDTYIPEERYSA